MPEAHFIAFRARILPLRRPQRRFSKQLEFWNRSFRSLLRVDQRLEVVLSDDFVDDALDLGEVAGNFVLGRKGELLLELLGAIRGDVSLEDPLSEAADLLRRVRGRVSAVEAAK